MVASNNPKIKASSKYLRMSPTKVRRVLTQLVGKSYEEALILLEYMPYRSCGPISKSPGLIRDCDRGDCILLGRMGLTLKLYLGDNRTNVAISIAMGTIRKTSNLYPA